MILLNKYPQNVGPTYRWSRKIGPHVKQVTDRQTDRQRVIGKFHFQKIEENVHFLYQGDSCRGGRLCLRPGRAPSTCRRGRSCASFPACAGLQCQGRRCSPGIQVLKGLYVNFRNFAEGMMLLPKRAHKKLFPKKRHSKEFSLILCISLLYVHKAYGQILRN